MVTEQRKNRMFLINFRVKLEKTTKEILQQKQLGSNISERNRTRIRGIIASSYGINFNADEKLELKKVVREIRSKLVNSGVKDSIILEMERAEQSIFPAIFVSVGCKELPIH